MLDGELTLAQEDTKTAQSAVQHPYTLTQDEHTVCESGDKECLLRLVAAFGDCA